MKDIIDIIESKKAVVGVIGLGYVGLPIVLRFCEAGFRVIGFDIDNDKVNRLNEGDSYISYIDAGRVSKFISEGTFNATADFEKLGESDAIIICVPTPLTNKREPDMQYVSETAKEISRHLRRGQFISLESTTYPGTTEELLLPLLVSKGLKVGSDFYLVYSPEREDPGRHDFTISNTPKVVGGITVNCLKAGEALYSKIVKKVITVTSTKAAEMSKLLENIYRSVNISLVNELKVLCNRMDIDIWEVIDAAKTKPFGFQAFYPGPGFGGHCIPIDPFYLTWKARQYDYTTRFIELAGEINSSMPLYVVENADLLLKKEGRTLDGSFILILGMAYKKDIDDPRESPSLSIIHLLMNNNAEVVYSDPHIPLSRGHRHFPGIDMKSIDITEEILTKVDLVILVTDHSSYDYDFIEKHARSILDTRDAFRRNGINSDKVARV